MLYLRSAFPYSLVAATLAVGLLEGPKALGSDVHPLQRASSLGFFALGVAAFRVMQLSPAMRLALAAGGALLAVDEWVMLHECLKFTTRTTLVGHDLLVPVYGAVGVIVLATIAPALEVSGIRWAHAVLSGAGAASAVAADAFGWLNAWPLASALAEEGGEALAIGGALTLLVGASSARGRILPAVAITTIFAATIAVAAMLVRPWICPPRLW